MTAYVIGDIHVIDPEGYAEYAKLAPPTVAQYGGRYIVRGGSHETLEGDWSPGRLVVLEFDDVEQAKSWIDGEEYAGPKALRQRHATASFVVVEGV